MTNNIVKKIINEELSRFNGKLNIFDFDETLVSDVAMVYIIKPDGTRTPISHHDYRSYKPTPDEQVDISEFDTVNDPIVNEPMMNLLKSAQGNSIILTARTEPKPIEEYLKTQGIDIPVFAVGSKDPNIISSAYNAKMKSNWLANAIKTFKIKEVEFWDDNRLNLYAINELCNSLGVKVKTHQVVFEPKRN